MYFIATIHKNGTKITNLIIEDGSKKLATEDVELYMKNMGYINNDTNSYTYEIESLKNSLYEFGPEENARILTIPLTIAKTDAPVESPKLINYEYEVESSAEDGEWIDKGIVSALSKESAESIIHNHFGPLKTGQDISSVVLTQFHRAYSSDKISIADSGKAIMPTREGILWDERHHISDEISLHNLVNSITNMIADIDNRYYKAIDGVDADALNSAESIDDVTNVIKTWIMSLISDKLYYLTQTNELENLRDDLTITIEKKIKKIDKLKKKVRKLKSKIAR